MVIISQVPVPQGEDINSLIQGHERGILKSLLDQRKVLSSGSKGKKSPSSFSSEPSKLDEKEKPHLDVSNPKLLVYVSPPLLFSLIGGVGSRNLEKLRVTLKVERQGSDYGRLRHSFDLYNDDHLEKYAQKAADRLDLGIDVVRRALYGLLDELEVYRLSRAEVSRGAAKVELSGVRRDRAVAYLSAPYLLKRTNEDIGKTGVVGERIGALIPEEDVIQCTASTENAFYYIKDGDLRHKLVLLEDLDGAEGVLYILRELMSKKWVSKLLAVKDASGKLETERVEVYGPISLAATTTRERLYEDNANRSLLIYPDGSKAHQEAIMEEQRRLSAGLIHEQEQEDLREFFKDMQRVLRPIKVRNPYAEELRIPEECFKPLRTHAHYLHFIETVTFYHQYQREVKVCEVSGEEYIETTLEDIEAANGLIKEVLLRKSDELSAACRDFCERLKEWLKKEGKGSFKRKEVRQAFRLHPSKLKRYVLELERYGLLKQIGGHRRVGYDYELEEVLDYGCLSSRVDELLSSLLLKLRKKGK